jgi:N-formylglutamate amidohydrolase
MAPGLGAPLLKVNVARAYVDTNREAYELDPFMLLGPLPIGANTDSERVQAGLGTIPRVVAENQRIYNRRMHVSEALQRINRVYLPVHKALADLIESARQSFNHAVLIDCHSMPSGSTFLRQPFRAGADIVLGDRHGTSCAPALITAAESWFRTAGYRVVRNRPYSGGYNTQHYGRPAAGLHALQIEINRALYMDERLFQPTAGMIPLMADLKMLAETLHALPASLFLPRGMADPDASFRQSAE